jgi:hypothetical protein
MIFLCTIKRRADILNLWPTNCTIKGAAKAVQTCRFKSGVQPNDRHHKMQGQLPKFRRISNSHACKGLLASENLTKLSLPWCIFKMCLARS